MREEEDVLAVRRPVEDAVVDAAARRERADVVVERELPRRAAVDADDEDLPRAAVVAGEGDPLAVGRELREVLHPVVGREPPRVAAVRGGEPEVAGIDEGDRVAVDVRLAQKPRLLRERGDRKKSEKKRQFAHTRREITRNGFRATARVCGFVTLTREE